MPFQCHSDASLACSALFYNAFVFFMEAQAGSETAAVGPKKKLVWAPSEAQMDPQECQQQPIWANVWSTGAIENIKRPPKGHNSILRSLMHFLRTQEGLPVSRWKQFLPYGFPPGVPLVSGPREKHLGFSPSVSGLRAPVSGLRTFVSGPGLSNDFT